MATNKDLQEEVKRLKTELAQHKKALSEAESTGIVSPVVEGTFKLTSEDADSKEGETITREFRFKPGRVRVPLANGQQVPSAALIRIANGGKATEKELENRPWLHTVTKEQAEERLLWFVQVGASMIEEV